MNEDAFRSTRAALLALPPEAISARLSSLQAQGRYRGEDEGPGYRTATVVGGVGIIPISGVIMYEANWRNRMIADWMGGTITEDVSADFDRLQLDPNVSRILFKINSPGGQALGLDALSEKIFAARGGKHMTAHMAFGCSAAYYIGSGADVIYAPRDATVGCIGTMTSWLNFDGMMEKMGVREVLIVSDCSPNKVPDENTDEGMALYREPINVLGWNFVDAVARNRGITRDAVVSDYGAGWVKVGAAALDAGMIDGLAPYDTVFNALISGKELPETQSKSKGAKSKMAGTKNKAGILAAVATLLGFDEPEAEEEDTTPAPPVQAAKPAPIVQAGPDPRDAKLADLEAQVATLTESHTQAQATLDAQAADSFMASIKGKVATEEEAAVREEFMASNAAERAAMVKSFARVPANPLLASINPKTGQAVATTTVPAPPEAKGGNGGADEPVSPERIAELQSKTQLGRMAAEHRGQGQGHA